MTRALKDNTGIKEAVSTYNDLGIEKALAELKKGIDSEKIKNSFNTLVAKKGKKADSFKFFENIRRTDKTCVYFHIPFCKNRCAYCVYEKIINSSKRERTPYLHSLKKEIELKRTILKDNLNPDIFYVGGGTPTVLEIEEIRIFLAIISEFFNIKDNLEFTFETTPRAVVEPGGIKKITLLKENGVNRINVGVESFSEEVIRKNGRIQRQDDIYRCFATLRKIGFKKINLDLIYGMMGQDLNIWQEDLDRTSELSPDSITTFALRIRSSAPQYRQYINNPQLFPSEKERIIMRIMAFNHFENSGYFEDNSDYFIKSEEKRYMYHPSQPHNIFRNLIGFGSSAYSLAGDMQIFNIKDTKEYIQMIQNKIDPIDTVITLSKREYIKRRFADCLRTKCNNRIFIEEFSTSILDELPGMIDKLIDMDLLAIEGDRIRLTRKGRLITDYIANHINYSDNPIPG